MTGTCKATGCALWAFSKGNGFCRSHYRARLRGGLVPGWSCKHCGESLRELADLCGWCEIELRALVA